MREGKMSKKSKGIETKPVGTLKKNKLSWGGEHGKSKKKYELRE